MNTPTYDDRGGKRVEMPPGAPLPVIKIAFDEETQQLRCGFETKEFKTWEAVKAIIRMARKATPSDIPNKGEILLEWDAKNQMVKVGRCPLTFRNDDFLDAVLGMAEDQTDFNLKHALAMNAAKAQQEEMLRMQAAQRNAANIGKVLTR
jgi:hypothetical protein